MSPTFEERAAAWLWNEHCCGCAGFQGCEAESLIHMRERERSLAALLSEVAREAEERGWQAGRGAAVLLLERKPFVPPSLDEQWCEGWFAARRDYAEAIRALGAGPKEGDKG